MMSMAGDSFLGNFKFEFTEQIQDTEIQDTR